MAYVLGYIVADGCIAVSKEKRKNPYTLNITSAEYDHLERVRDVMNSAHKIGKKPNGITGKVGYQLQIRRQRITDDLLRLGINPRKTENLHPISVPDLYFHDFVRGFFDGDGTVYIYNVNGTPQLKSGFVCASFEFLSDLNSRICTALGIPKKAIHEEIFETYLPRYSVDYYISDSIKLAEFMYYDDCICMPRKRKIFEQWSNTTRRKYNKKTYPSKIGWHLNS